MKKFKIGISFFILVFICVTFNKFLVLLNYFSALALHELAHLFIAKSRGYKLKQIKLDMFGLAVDLDENISDKDSFAVNIAGPAMNLFICLLCVVIYWFFPVSVLYLNTFCLANLALALFNLLPVYPLDGGKIFSSIIHNEKAYTILDRVIRLIILTVFFCLFICTYFNKPNFLFLVLGVFFVTSFKRKAPTFSLLKYRKQKDFQRAIILKITGEETLFYLLKKIKQKDYTIFYFNQKYIDEDNVIDLSLKNPLTCRIVDVL